MSRWIQRMATGSPAGSSAQEAFAAAARGDGREVPYRARMERAFGADFSPVRAHLGRSDELAALGARAATSGEKVVFASRSPDQEVVAHELTHVVQQRSAEAPASGVSSPADASEREATAVSRRVASGQQADVHAAPSGGVHRDLGDEVLAAVARIGHVLQQNRVYGIIRAGLAVTPDPANGVTDVDFLLRNSCEWLAQGNCDLVVLSPIHDAATRQPGDIGYFDRTVSYPDLGGHYPADPAVVNDPAIQYEDPDTVGGMAPGGTRLTIIDPASTSDDFLRETIIHEVQHDADQSWPGQRWADPAGSAFNDYQSEFRAYWIENGEGGADDTFGSSLDPATNADRVSFTDPATGTTTSVPTNFVHLRQENIFWHLVDGGYDYVAQNYVQVPAFKTMADGLDSPVGGNLVNSVRIQELSDALAACSSAMVPGDPEVEDMLAAAGKLDQLDRQYLQDEELSAGFWAQASANLSAAVVGMLHNMVWFGIRYPVGDFPEPTGDTTYA